jgi:hypothetical protein
VQSASDPYVASLDVRLQKCIEKHKDLLASMTVDEATSQQAVVEQILARVQELDSLKSGGSTELLKMLICTLVCDNTPLRIPCREA